MELPERFSITSDGKPLLILDETIPEDGSKVWGFASELGLSILKKAKDVYGDGTFEICKNTLFSQLWVVVARSEQNKLTTPCAFFLLPSKHHTVYTMILQKLKELGVTSPDVFHLDFEASAIKSVREVYSDCEIICYDVHRQRGIQKSQQKTRLLPYINAAEEVQTFNRYLWALAYVPISDILKVYEEFIMPKLPKMDLDVEDEDTSEAYNKAMDTFIESYETTWLGKVSKRTKQRGKPKFKFELWNKYATLLAGEMDMTTNKSEAWNSASQLSLPMKPYIFQVLDAIKTEEGLARAKLHQAITGSPPKDANPGRTKARLRRMEALKGIVEQYEDLSLDTYMNSLNVHFNEY